MTTLLAVVHVFIALVLILLVLIQDGRPPEQSGWFWLHPIREVDRTSRTGRLQRAQCYRTCILLTISTTHRGGSVVDGHVPPPVATVPAAAPVDGSATAPAPSAGSTQTDEKTKNAPTSATDVDKK